MKVPLMARSQEEVDQKAQAICDDFFDRCVRPG